MPVNKSGEITYTFYPLGLIFILGAITLLIRLICKRHTLQSKQRTTLILLVAVIVGSTFGWFGRKYVDVYKYNHPTPYVDCPNR